MSTIDASRWRRPFSDELLEAAQRSAERLSQREPRPEITSELLLAIDDPETTELDDAVQLVKRLPGGWRVAVHIAEPGFFVYPNEPLDREAQQRGTTLYLPDQRYPLFPKVLSEGAMSLLPGELRPALSFTFDVTRDGGVERFTPSLSYIKVTKKLSYEEADERLYQGGDEGKALSDLLEVAEALRQHRLDAGALIFSSPEFLPVQKEDGSLTLKKIDPSSPSRDIITELMISTNFGAAQLFAKAQLPAIYRTQEWSGSPKAQSLPEGYEPFAVYQLAAHLKKVEVSPKPKRHVGMGLPQYLQITSPIRRYTDLLLQRQLKAFVQKQPLPYRAERFWELAIFAEGLNAEARKYEGSVRTGWFLRYLSQHIGQKTNAVVLRDNGADTYLVELTAYAFRTTLVSKRRLMPGEQVAVVIQSATPEDGLLSLSVVS